VIDLWKGEKMDSQNVNFFKQYPIVVIITLVVVLLYLILKVIEVIRYLNYGRLNKDTRSELKECKWKKKYYVQEGIKKYICVRPRLWLKRDNDGCQNKCRYRRFETLPKYEEMIIIRYMDQIIAIFASLYALFKGVLEIYKCFFVK